MKINYIKTVVIVTIFLLSISMTESKLFCNETKIDQEIINKLKTKANSGDVTSQLGLGAIYMSGEYIPENYKESYKWFRLAADNENVNGYAGLGYLYYNGKGVDRDYSMAFKNFSCAAEKGIPVAQYHLGKMYYYGQGVQNNYKIGFKWFRKAADNGIEESKFRIWNEGYYYTGKEINEKKGFNKIREAADNGIVYAQLRLGELFYDGMGVQKNYDSAFIWTKTAAENGNLEAEYFLGILYFYGVGVTSDSKKAEKHFLLAAHKGYTRAKFKLGEIYYYGDGVIKNIKKGVKWLKLAEKQGNTRATDLLEKIFLKEPNLLNNNHIAGLSQKPSTKKSKKRTVKSDDSRKKKIDISLSSKVKFILQNGTDTEKEKITNEVIENPGKYCPFIFYILSHELYNSGKRNLAVKWFYFGRFRANVDALICKDKSARSAVAVLEKNFRRKILKYAWNYDKISSLKRIPNIIFKMNSKIPYDYDQRWIYLHGMGVMLKSLDTKTTDRNIPSFTQNELYNAVEKTKEKFITNFKSGIKSISSDPEHIMNPLTLQHEDLTRKSRKKFKTYKLDAAIKLENAALKLGKKLGTESEEYKSSMESITYYYQEAGSHETCLKIMDGNKDFTLWPLYNLRYSRSLRLLGRHRSAMEKITGLMKGINTGIIFEGNTYIGDVLTEFGFLFLESKMLSKAELMFQRASEFYSSVSSLDKHKEHNLKYGMALVAFEKGDLDHAAELIMLHWNFFKFYDPGRYKYREAVHLLVDFAVLHPQHIKVPDDLFKKNYGRKHAISKGLKHPSQ